jgi:predicted negative regulator of RcsB-dependent stress response
VEHEDQQVEQIKQFLREYGIWIGAGIVIGLGSLFGWRAYQASNLQEQSQNTALFQQVSEQLRADDGGLAAAESLLSELEGTSHAVIARLQMAQQAVREGNLERAADILYTAQEEASEPAIKALATTRLARVQLALGEYDAALSSLQPELPASFTAQVAEVRGDIYLAQGDLGQARSAYETAVNEGGVQTSPALQMKFDNLAGE